MSDPVQSVNLSRAESETLLRSFDCANPRNKTILSPTVLRSALLTLNQHADYRIFGICADTAHQAYTTLLEYFAALDEHEISEDCPDVQGPVYIKFNTKTGFFHVDTYTGEHRGVLVSFQSAYDDGVNDLYGHFPLDLFTQTSK